MLAIIIHIIQNFNYLITIMMFYRINHTFSLLTKIPKTTAAPAQPKSWYAKLFTKNQDSATYILLKQLFQYLQNTDLFHKQLPYLSNAERLLQNNMIIHVHLLKDRIKQQVEVPRSEIQKFNYNAQTYFFPDYAGFINTAIPTQNFREHYSQSYMKKLQLYSEMIKGHEWTISPNKQLISFEMYAPILRKVLYQNRVQVNNVQLLKYSKYFTAHKKYLSLLDWNDIIQYKVKWGLESMKYLAQVQSANIKGQKK